MISILNEQKFQILVRIYFVLLILALCSCSPKLKGSDSSSQSGLQNNEPPPYYPPPGPAPGPAPVPPTPVSPPVSPLKTPAVGGVELACAYSGSKYEVSVTWGLDMSSVQNVLRKRVLGAGWDLKNYIDIGKGVNSYVDADVTGGVTYEYQVKYDAVTVSTLVSIKLDPETCLQKKSSGSSLPSANHGIDFGYYYADGRYGNFSSEVYDYTNLALLGPDIYLSEAMWGSLDPKLNIEMLFNKSLKEAFDQKKSIYLTLGEEKDWDKSLNVARNYWSRVKYIELSHEDPKMTADEMQNLISRLEARLKAFNLRRPYLVALESIQAEHAKGIDCAAIEAYTPTPLPNVTEQADAAKQVQIINKVLTDRKAKVPEDKCIIIVMQAYDRNFEWKNLESMKQIQFPAYMHAYNDLRVSGILMFSYARPGGTKYYPELKSIHQDMSKAIREFSFGFFPELVAK